MLTMKEILDKPRAWAVLDADTQITKEKTYVHQITVRVGSNGDQVDLYDGVGVTGKKFNIMIATDDNTNQFDIGLIFHNGLYFKDTSGNANVVISYVAIAD